MSYAAMRWLGGALVALAFVGGAASAAETPRPGLTDPRIRTVFYNPDDVVVLTGDFGFQMMIQFAADEHIENVAIGDATAWQITPNKKATLLFVKPLDRAPPTNMTVVTDQRSYLFELRARPPRRGRPDGMAPDGMAYVVRFTYPRPPAPATAVVAPAPPTPPQRRNTAYTYTGSRELLPSVVFDDGRFTYFRWPEGATTPALFAVGADGSESLVNYSWRDGYEAVEQVAQRFSLRDGKAVTTVINDAWRAPLRGEQAPHPHDAKTAREAVRQGVQP